MTRAAQLAQAAAGGVLQVVSASLANAMSINTTGSTDIMTATITPKVATSKILVLITLEWNSGNPNAGFYLTRNNGELNPQVRLSGSWVNMASNVTGGYKSLDEAPINSWNTFPETLNVVDNPATTSACTYKFGVYQLGNGSSFEVGRSSSNSTYGGNGGRIILMEIAG